MAVTAFRCVFLAALLAGTGALSRSLPPGEWVWLSGCVMDGEHFGPVQADVSIWLPERGRTRVVRADLAGRFVVAVPHHARIVVSVSPGPSGAAPAARGAQTLEVTTGAADVAMTGCLVVW